VQAGASVRVDVRTLSHEERLEEALFMGLRLSDGLDLAALRRVYGVDVVDRYGDELQRFVEAGFVEHREGGRLALTRPGMLVANEIMMVFIGNTGTVK
jgi:oxygen-independent coproporphyrinogen-3 oxidase